MIVAGSMIGSGIFIVSADIADKLGPRLAVDGLGCHGLADLRRAASCGQFSVTQAA